MSPSASGGGGLLRRARRNFAYLTAFCMDLTLGAGMIAFNYLAKDEYRASPGQLGLIALITASVYFCSSLVLGRLSDHWGRRPSIVAGCMAIAAAFALGIYATALWHIYALMAFAAVAMGSFWPALEADISDHSTPAQLPHRVGRFNVAWCSGFAVTGLTAGALCQFLGHRSVLLGVAAIGLATIPVYLARTFKVERDPPAGDREPRGLRDAARSGRFWKMALVLNFAAMGANCVLRYHVPTVTGGEHSALGGGYLTVLFAAETLTFVVLGKWHGWHYSRWPLITSVLLIVGGGLLCGLFNQTVLVFAAGSALTGVGCGLIYNSSIYYSVAAETGRGQRGGIHESALALGQAAVPYAGGLLAMIPWLSARPVLQKGTPFLVGSAFMILASLVAAAIAMRGSQGCNATPQPPALPADGR